MYNYLPLVSVGLPVYNGENYVKSAIESILAQTYTNFELIISDNASTDSTQKICEEMAQKDSRIKYFRNEINIGASGNFRRVFELSAGKYFKWTGHDDVSAPGLLESLVNVLEHKEDYILCYSRTTRINEKDEVITSGYSDGLALYGNTPQKRLGQFFHRFRSNTYCEPAFGLVRREVLAKTRLIEGYIASDEIMLGELAMRGRFFEVPESYFFRRIHPDAAGHKNRSVKDLAAWYNPGNRKKLQLRRWRMFAGYMDAVRRVPLSAYSKIACYWQVLLWAARHWKGLSFEILILIRQLFSAKKQAKTNYVLGTK
ncbi:MAG: glycosyltransferase family 2 protein [Bacteroidota bacterium]